MAKPTFEDYQAVIDAQEAKIRSDWVNTMEARLVREELAKCWREEGVNHYQSCHALSEKYLDMVRTHRVTGYRKLDFKS
ncbi:hypothetical protein P389DRAFT_171378 [Cystobasidium minutum MCA 4210]|uniref:uncharacterized protein n=1 Tax=Cystobasidium minutum MCA 4210 TaxID=1397322 RepID=UPI0034CD8058|eukprot:jgi/Rhomi1/171378/fgenesh1_kg.4_\